VRINISFSCVRIDIFSRVASRMCVRACECVCRYFLTTHIRVMYVYIYIYIYIIRIMYGFYLLVVVVVGRVTSSRPVGISSKNTSLYTSHIYVFNVYIIYIYRIYAATTTETIVTTMRHSNIETEREREREIKKKKETENQRHTRRFISSRPSCIIIISRRIVSIHSSADRFLTSRLRQRVRFYYPRFTTPRRRQLPPHGSINLTFRIPVHAGEIHHSVYLRL
jgi:hypothetical protein